jgi:glycosyltransferase involved in cell wall biosynthesis
LDAEPQPVRHLLDAMGGGKHLWGKEKVVWNLVRAQRDSGRVLPSVVTFTPSRLGELLLAEGFEVRVLADRVSRFRLDWIRGLARMADERPGTVLHTHGYKANLVARWPGLRRRFRRVIATCHGWVDTSRMLRIYNRLDRWTARFSDAVTVPDPAMLARFPTAARALAVLNGIPDRAPPSASERAVARARFGLPADAFVCGFLGRLSEEKGIEEYVEAFERLGSESPIVFAVGGAGPLEEALKVRCPGIRWLGFVESAEFLAAIDLFVQSSRTEGLSLALLEGMSAGRAILATSVGATASAITDGVEGWLLPPRDPDRLARDIKRIANLSPTEREGAGTRARARFEREFRIDAVADRLLELYLGRF